MVWPNIYGENKIRNINKFNTKMVNIFPRNYSFTCHIYTYSLKVLLFLILWVKFGFVHMYSCTLLAELEPTEDRRGHWILWILSYRQFRAVVCMLEIKPRSSGRETSVLCHCAISPVLKYIFNNNFCAILFWS